MAGGAQLAQQYLNTGLLDEMQLHIAPVLLGSGVRLFDHLNEGVPFRLERVRCAESAHATHLTFRLL